MPEHVLLVEKISYWKDQIEGYPVVTAAEYLTDPLWQQKKALHIVNLCRSQKYLGEGYYCSLLAEARGHKVIPSVRSLRDLSRKSLYSLETEDLDKRVQRILGKRILQPHPLVIFGVEPAQTALLVIIRHPGDLV